MPARQSPWFATLRERLDCMSIPEPNSGCLLWLGSVMGIGYGKVSWRGKQHPSHRMAWVDAHGAPAPGLKVLHRCDVPSCINLRHLFLGTDADNVADKVRKGRQARGLICVSSATFKPGHKIQPDRSKAPSYGRANSTYRSPKDREGG